MSVFLILVCIVGLFTYKSNTTFSTEEYLSRLENVSEFPEITAISDMLDEWEEITESDETETIKAIKKVWLLLRCGVSLIIQVVLYPIRVFVWIIEFVSIVFFGFDTEFVGGAGGGVGGGGSSGR